MTQLRREGLGLRVATPRATQRAPFEEYQRTNPRAVVHGVVLNVKYDARIAVRSDSGLLRHRLCSVRQIT